MPSRTIHLSSVTEAWLLKEFDTSVVENAVEQLIRECREEAMSDPIDSFRTPNGREDDELDRVIGRALNES